MAQLIGSSEFAARYKDNDVGLNSALHQALKDRATLYRQVDGTDKKMRVNGGNPSRVWLFSDAGELLQSDWTEIREHVEVAEVWVRGIRETLGGWAAMAK